MATAVLNKAHKEIGQLAEKFSSPHSYGNKKTVSQLKKVLVVTTDKESLKNSFSIIKDVEEFISKLPVKQDDINEVEIKKQIQTSNKNIQSITEMLNDVKGVLYNDGGKIEIDDVNMVSFLKNMTKALEGMKYCSDYLGLVLQVQNEKKANKNITSFTHLIDLINAA